jgi:hypothetical protein
MTPDLAAAVLLTAALGFALLDTRGRPAPSCRRCGRGRQLDGDWARGDRDEPPGFMLHLSNVGASTWRATFGREPVLSSDGFGTGPTPCRAVQVAAWNALGQTPGDEQGPTPAEDVILP